MDSRVECFWGSKTLRPSCDQTIIWNSFSAPSSSWSPLISSNHSYHHHHHHHCYPQQDILSQIRQLDYLLSKAQDIKIADRSVISFLPYDHDQDHETHHHDYIQGEFWRWFRGHQGLDLSKDTICSGRCHNTGLILSHQIQTLSFKSIFSHRHHHDYNSIFFHHLGGLD